MARKPKYEPEDPVEIVIEIPDSGSVPSDTDAEPAVSVPEVSDTQPIAAVDVSESVKPNSEPEPVGAEEVASEEVRVLGHIEVEVVAEAEPEAAPAPASPSPSLPQVTEAVSMASGAQPSADAVLPSVTPVKKMSFWQRLFGKRDNPSSSSAPNSIAATEESQETPATSEQNQQAEDEASPTSLAIEPQVEIALADVPLDTVERLMEIPMWNEPDWRDEFSLVQRRIEPCDLTGHVARTSEKRLLARTIDAILLKVQVRVSERLAARAVDRFQEQLSEHDAAEAAIDSLTRWRAEQSNSVAWQLVDAVDAQVDRALEAKESAIAHIKERSEFTNPEAIETYRRFASAITWAPIIMLYVDSVLLLTYNRFEWVLRHLPFFNYGPIGLFILSAAFAGLVVLRAMWRYSTQVALTQRRVVNHKAEFERQYQVVTHASKEHARLVKQQPMVEPLLRVLAVGYRAKWNSSLIEGTRVTTDLESEKLPACVTVAKAVDGDGVKMNQIRTIALRTLISAGWRTRSMEQLGELHATSQLANANALRLSSLDSDLGQSTASARAQLLAAFSDEDLLARVGRDRLRETVITIHNEILRNVDADLRPPVESIRVNGFEQMSLNTSWLDLQEDSEDWVAFLTSILGPTSPFNTLNIEDKRSTLNAGEITSLAVIPNYLASRTWPLRTEAAPEQQIAPIDVVVRVDVSDWAPPEAFKVFALDAKSPSRSEEEPTDMPRPGVTSV